MKTITIPKRFGYPTLDITVNGKVYTVKSGEEITIEDHVAEAIENAITLEPKPKRYLGKLAQLANGTLPEITVKDLDGVETIVEYAFRNCYSVASIEIPDTVKSVGKSSFLGCTNAKSVRFGDNSKLESIGANAFEWCNNLLRVYLPPTPPALENINAFSDISAKCVFCCKTQASLEAYKKAENWSTLTGTYTFKVEE